MVKKFLILSTFLLLTFFPLDTFAFDSSTSIYLNNQKLTSQYKQYVAGAQNVYVSIRSDSTSIPDYSTYKYGYVALCSAFGSYSNRYVDTVGSSYVQDMAVVNSTTGCTIPTTNAYITTARVLYITYTIPDNMYNCGSSGPCYFSHDLDFAFYQTGSTEFSLVSYGFSNEPFNFNSQVDSTVYQNQQIIEQNQTIINQQNQNTQDIINNQDSNTQDIIDNQQQNTQDIIDNQNQNTQEQIESQKVCNTFTLNKDNILLPNSYLSNNGSVLSSTSGNGISDYYEIDSTTSISILPPIPDTPQNACFYTSSKTLISCFRQNSIPSIPENAKYIRFTLNSSNINPRFSLFSCINGNQALNDSVNDLNDTLNDTSQPNTNQDISDMNNMVASDTPISDLITMPLTLINSYINGISSSCSPVNLGNLYGTDLVLPCINLEQRLGSDLWGKIDILFCIFMCYNIGMLFITAFDGITSLRDDFESLYQPRHADVGYQPKHGGGN